MTWASVFPLDVIKTRAQTQHLGTLSVLQSGEHCHLLPLATEAYKVQHAGRLSTIDITKRAYRTEGVSVFFRGLGVCSIRAFIVNAVQWAVYEWMMQLLRKV